MASPDLALVIAPPDYCATLQVAGHAGGLSNGVMGAARNRIFLNLEPSLTRWIRTDS